MQQYFVDVPLEVGDEYVFNKEQAHHALNVMKMHHDQVRLVSNGIGYFADAHNSDHGFVADVLTKDERINEMDVDVILAMGLIRKEKFELVLQKASELGVKRVIPFESSRTIVKIKKEKKDKRLARWQSILQEGSEQCKRNMIPILDDVMTLDEVMKLEADCKLVPYENAYGESPHIKDVVKKQTILIAIGPEGGFSEEEIHKMKEHGFMPVTLGKRILRAETAVMYSLSVINELDDLEEIR